MQIRSRDAIASEPCEIFYERPPSKKGGGAPTGAFLPWPHHAIRCCHLTALRARQRTLFFSSPACGGRIKEGALASRRSPGKVIDECVDDSLRRWTLCHLDPGHAERTSALGGARTHGDDKRWHRQGLAIGPLERCIGLGRGTGRERHGIGVGHPRHEHRLGWWQGHRPIRLYAPNIPPLRREAVGNRRRGLVGAREENLIARRSRFILRKLVDQPLRPVLGGHEIGFHSRSAQGVGGCGPDRSNQNVA